MQDLRKRVGQNTVSTALDLRKLGYLGHMGRCAPDRLERQLAFGRLDIEGGLPRASKQGTTWRTQCCSLLAQLRHFFLESFRDLPWTALAAERDQWRSTVHEWLSARQAVDANRHASTEERRSLQIQAYARLGLSPPTPSAPQFSQASDAAAAGLQAAPRPKRGASEWALQRVTCPRYDIQTQRRQLRSHQQFTCPASRVAGTAPSVRALQQVRKQAGSQGRGRGRGSLSSSATVAAPRALTVSQRGEKLWSTEEFVEILLGGGPQPPARRRGNQWSAQVELGCIFCSRTAAQLGLVNIRTHQVSCIQRPLELIRADFVRQCLKKHRSAEMIKWSLPCPHCGVPFPSTTMRRTHITACLRRYQQNCQLIDRYSEQLGPEILTERLRFFRAQVDERSLGS